MGLHGVEGPRYTKLPEAVESLMVLLRCRPPSRSSQEKFVSQGHGCIVRVTKHVDSITIHWTTVEQRFSCDIQILRQMDNLVQAAPVETC